VPPEIVFSPAEIDRMTAEIRVITVPHPVRRRLEFFASQFEFCELAGVQFEYLTKDTARLSGSDWLELSAADNGRDRLGDIGCQTLKGLSVRNLMALLAYAKAMAYFRGNAEVELEDLRQVLPFVLRDKLRPDLDSPFFAQPENLPFKSDRISWLRQLFDTSCQEYDRLALDEDDSLASLEAEFARGLEGLSERDTRTRLSTIERQIDKRIRAGKLYGPVHDELLKLKYLHQRYSNYLSWLRA
jgi:hypothetical protein